MLQGSQPEGDLGPQGSWSLLGMRWQMWGEGSCLDLHPVLTRNLFLLVHSFRVSGLTDLSLPNLGLLTGQGQGHGHGSHQDSLENGEGLAIIPINGFW